MRFTGEQGLLPVGVLTGFLGSGKTTLLRRILEAEEYGDSAVLINEFGEVGLDHILVGEIAPDVVLLNSGCLCCTLRGELKDALSSLLSQRTRGLIPPFKRVIVETTGVAQPSLILSTVFADPQIRHHYTIGDVVATVDSMHALTQAKEQDVWMEQITAADDLIVTKTDLVSPEQAAAVHALLDSVNPTAHRHLPEAQETLSLFTLRAKGHEKTEAEKKFRLSPFPQYPGHTGHVHDSVRTVRVCAENPLDWEAFGVWLSMLLHAHGNNIMRVKGILYLEESGEPVVIQGVQHVIHPPEHLSGWGDLPRRTDLVFILRNINPDLVSRSFTAFVSGEQ